MTQKISLLKKELGLEVIEESNGSVDSGRPGQLYDQIANRKEELKLDQKNSPTVLQPVAMVTNTIPS